MHEFVKPSIKMSPHIRIQMNSSNTFWMIWWLNSISLDKGSCDTIKENIFHLKELANTVAQAGQGPQIHFGYKIRFKLQSRNIEEMQSDLNKKVPKCISYHK